MYWIGKGPAQINILGRYLEQIEPAFAWMQPSLDDYTLLAHSIEARLQCTLIAYAFECHIAAYFAFSSGPYPLPTARH
jgi:hypothetical protein